MYWFHANSVLTFVKFDKNTSKIYPLGFLKLSELFTKNKFNKQGIKK